MRNACTRLGRTDKIRSWMPERKTKLFLSHAWEDKCAIAQRLYEALKEKFDVWYDRESLQLGESLTFEVSEGLRSCDYGLVVLSESYMQKKWTRDEYTGLVNLETSEKRIILPIWHKVGREQVVNFSPILADRVAVSSDQGIDVMVAWIEGAVWGSKKARELGDPLQRKFSELVDRFALKDLNEELSTTQKGIPLAQTEVTRLFEIFWKRLDQVEGKHKFQRSNQNTPPMLVRVAGRNQVSLEIRYVYLRNDFGFVPLTSDVELQFQVYTPDKDFPEKPDKRDLLEERSFWVFFVSGPKVVWEMVLGEERGEKKLFSSEEVVDLALDLFIDNLGTYWRNV
jgi:hypothetical protein